jgi:isopenicillin-N epimerase
MRNEQRHRGALSRRGFLGGTAAVAFASFNEPGLARALDMTRYIAGRSPEDVARDEDFWFEIQRAFTVDRTWINLNNGGVSPSPRIVQEAMKRYLDFSNLAPTHTMWRILEPQIESVRRRLARAFGCDVEEMAITRNASEALEICQLGLALKPGDEIVTTNQDYPRMLNTWRQRERRDGIVVRKISFPVPPPTWEELAERLERAVTPKTRVIHFCHITNLTGQIFPVKRVCRFGRERGMDVIVDGAHAFAHFPFTHADLDCDFYGTSLHKWLTAPHGTGFLYMRKSRIKDVWPLMPADEKQDSDIRKFEEIGTHPAANHNAIIEALDFHEGIGADRKGARLRYLFQRWAKRLEAQKGVKILTSFDPRQSCGLATFNIDGIDPYQLGTHLYDQYRIISTPIGHEEFRGLRITPNVYTTIQEIDTFAEAVEKVIAKGMS